MPYNHDIYGSLMAHTKQHFIQNVINFLKWDAGLTVHAKESIQSWTSIHKKWSDDNVSKWGMKDICNKIYVVIKPYEQLIWKTWAMIVCIDALKVSFCLFGDTFFSITK